MSNEPVDMVVESNLTMDEFISLLSTTEYATSSPFESLPGDVLKRIIGFHQGDYFFLSRLGRTCRTFRRILHESTNDSELWETHSSEYEKPQDMTWRQFARRLALIYRMKCEQESEAPSIILTEMGSDNFATYMRIVLAHKELPPLDLGFSKYAICALAELLEANVVHVLGKALGTSLSAGALTYKAATTGREPCHLLNIALGLCCDAVFDLSCNYPFYQDDNDPFSEAVEIGLPWDGKMEHFEQGHGERNRVIRRLAFKAGLAEIEYSSFPIIWNLLLSFALSILKPIVISRSHEPEQISGLPSQITQRMIQSRAKEVGLTFHTVYLLNPTIVERSSKPSSDGENENLADASYIDNGADDFSLDELIYDTDEFSSRSEEVGDEASYDSDWGSWEIAGDEDDSSFSYDEDDSSVSLM